ncbi:acylglycerol lipase [Aureococcus anophagefferens]|nr:acylglycerol lipase [Aureococcus anophagefferens]
MEEPAKSIASYSVEDVQDWLRALGLGRYHDEVAAKRINGRVLLCLVTNECLAQLGITSGADVATILWTVEAQIKAGDEGAHAIVDPSIFLSVADASRSTAEAAKARKRASVPGAARAEDSDEERAPKPKRDDDVDDDDDDDDEGFAAAEPDLLGLGDAAPAAPAPALPDEATLTPTKAPDVPPETPVDGARKAPGGRHVMCETCQSVYPRGIQIFNSTSIPVVEFHTGMYWSASGATKTCRVCRQREEELAELKRREAEALRGDHMAPNVRAEYEVSFLDRGPLNMVLEELDLYKIVVRGFTPTDDGAVGFAESCGKIAVDDELVGVNGLAVDRLKFNESIELIRSAEWPLAIRFRRPALGDSMKLFSNWSANALKHALLEADADVPVGAGRSRLVALCRDVFRDRAPSALPAKAAPPVVAGGVRAIFAGATSISGFLLVKVPGDPAVRRFFGKLVGNRLQFHRPSKHAEAGYLPEPAVAIAMERVALVTATRSSEEGIRDLRVVVEDEATEARMPIGGAGNARETWILAADAEAHLRDWASHLSMAQLVGPGSRTSGLPEPSAPVLEAKTSTSLTVRWQPPRAPYLDSVAAFQVTYGAPGLLGGAWRIASDECHATRCCVKGLKPDTTYVVRVRALHELSRGTTLWGDWSGTSKRLATDRVRYGARGRDPSHCWILVHGLHGTPFDMSHLAAAVEARCPSDALVHVAEANAGRTLDGVAAGGDRLVREISSVLRGKPKVDKLSFVCHDLGGLYARYALKALWAGGAVREWDEGGGEPAPSRALGGTARLANFVTFASPHLGSPRLARRCDGGPKTRRELLLEDRAPVPGRPALPLVLRLALDDDFLAPLKCFRRRACYANVKYDRSVEYASASVREKTPYASSSDDSLRQLVDDDAYRLVMVLAAGEDVRPADERPPPPPGSPRFFGLGARPRPLHAEDAGRGWVDASDKRDRASYFAALRNLQACGWDRVDVFNAGLMNNADLIVRREWMNAPGFDVVKHCLDHAALS